ncbi:MAG: MFS transporter [Candidatus Thermoplasmatota archaeon]|jgi:UMF1 family MFS transporter|nr:MFS transporter [Candidatus Thermoplasmatota archaeon]MED5274053.1 MFS transporter [Candidatus Thermoplasmatota archaeon]
MSDAVELDRASDPKAVRGYAFYDWGKSAFETSTTVAILPAWYAYLFLEANGLTTTIAGIDMTGDAVWAYAVAAATLLVAILAPAFGVIADKKPVKMTWIRYLTYIGAGSTFLIGFDFLYAGSEWVWLMVFFLLANIGLNGAGVFYNAMLPHMGTDDEMDDISNRAFAYGYLGGGILLLIHFILVLGVGGDFVIRLCLASAGVWWYGFALLTFKYVPEPPMEGEEESIDLRSAYQQVIQTLKEVSKFRTLFIYMLAYFFFIDGINTVTALGGVFGSTVLGVTTTELMVTILAIQFVAWPSALGFTKLANNWGTKKALSASLAGWVVLCFAACAFAPLALDSHDQHDVLFEWDSDGDGIADSYDDDVDGDWFDNAYEIEMGTDPFDYMDSPSPLPQTWLQQRLATAGSYVAYMNWNFDHSIAQKTDFSDDEFNEQEWVAMYSGILPVEIGEKSGIYDWKWGSSEDAPHMVKVNDQAQLQDFLASIGDTRFSASVSGGPLDESSSVGIDHPTNLGDGPIDVIPETVRDIVWEPLGLTVGLQFLLLGCGMGTLLGGSQGLARSMFGQMVPETRSAEFFGFFGFFGKVAAFIGPLLYATLTVMYGSRVGVFCISLLILIGAYMMRMVDVDDGRAAARAEDARNRGISIDS